MPKLTQPIVVCLTLVILAGLITGCIPTATSQLGPRPAPDTLGAVEAYLRKYQPGPLPACLSKRRPPSDRHGVLLAERWAEGRRTWMPLNRISKHLIDATIANRGCHVFHQPRVDPARSRRRLGNAQQGDVVSGASTITMQLARNLFFGPDQRYQQSMDRKVLEAGLAQEMTSLFSKDEILEMYLNLLNYGHLAYGRKQRRRSTSASPRRICLWPRRRCWQVFRSSRPIWSCSRISSRQSSPACRAGHDGAPWLPYAGRSRRRSRAAGAESRAGGGSERRPISCNTWTMCWTAAG